MINVATFHKLCKTVIQSANADDYAKSYAMRGLHICEDQHAIRSQILYILSNLDYWRGVEARETKLAFKLCIRDSGS